MTNVSKLQWRESVERMRGLFVLILVVQVLFTLIAHQYKTTTLFTYVLPSTVFITIITLICLVIGAFKMGDKTSHDVFRLPPSVKWRVDLLLLALLCLYGSVTALLTGYIPFLFIKETDLLYMDGTLLTAHYFYVNVIVCFGYMLAIALISYTFRLLMTYRKMFKAILYIVINVTIVYVLFTYNIKTIPNAKQLLLISLILILLGIVTLRWQFKGGRAS